MAGTIVVGAQWGDEGKGKIVDFLSQRADVVVRFNGGANAGHTVLFNGKELRLHQIPSGVLNGATSILGNGMVIDPVELVDELKMLSSVGIEPVIFISDRASVVMPYHKEIDRIKGKGIGTTGKGIGPAYEDKIGRNNLRICDIIHQNAGEIISQFIDEKRDYLIFEGVMRDDKFESYKEKIVAQYTAIGKQIAGFVTNTSLLLNKFLREGKNVLFEGAQGVLLDIDFGTYPFVTSSNTIAQGALIGTGVSPSSINRIIGVTKAYTTRVGEGPFPTEIKGSNAEMLRKRGKEYGATTGRPRRVGYLDLFALKYAVEVSGIRELAITKIDILSTITDLKVAVSYELDRKRLDYPPANAYDLQRVVPVYETLEPVEHIEKSEWEKLKGHTKDNLPSFIRTYISFIEEFTGVPVTILSYGPERSDTIEYR
uniref:Adenylosuccinate synthetase n=1 Tax=Caldisericum exile TaxID=693075 RepID=A0A7C4U3P9_9BACT